MRRSWMLAAAFVAASGLGAQEGAKAKAEYALLVAEYDLARAAATQKQREIAASEEYKQAREARDTAKAQELMAGASVDVAAFVAKFQAGAQRHRGSEGAVPFLCWIANQSGDAEAMKPALDTLVADHLSSAGLLDAVERPMWAYRGLEPDDSIALLGKIADGSAHDVVRAYAKYDLALMLKRSKPKDADAMAQAEALTAEAEKLAAGTELEMRIQAPRFEKEHLQIGMEAPDIAGEDLDGVAFRLGDYRGKVVVIDFWGDW